jgi:hypothetical protein
MNKIVFLSKIENLIELLKSLENNKQNVIFKDKFRQFMLETLELYLALKTDYSLNSDVNFQNYLNESAIKLISRARDLDFFIADIEQALSFPFYGDEWINICYKRSSIEALKEIYKNTSFNEHFDYFEKEYLEELDDTIRWKGEKERYIPHQAQIPVGIPPSHWWWYPDPPPETSVF